MSTDTLIDAMREMIDKHRDENAKLRAERDMWKANHDSQVELKRIICDRPDMGDRAKRVAGLMAQIADLTAAVEDLTQAVADAEVALDYMNHYSWDFRYQAKGAAALERFRNRNTKQEPQP